MARKRTHRKSSSPSTAGRQPRTALCIVSAGSGQWRLQYPSGVAERADDLAEVEQMIAVGELDCAIEELRWLLQGCSDLLAAHQLLGTMALEEEDYALGRGHFGIVYDLVREVLPPNGLRGTLPYAIAENQVIYESGRGLAHCLRKTDKVDLARDVVRQLLEWDPSDPVKLRTWIDGWT